MPTHGRRENVFVKRFLQAYESRSWVDASVRWLDQEIDGGVEALATRKDGVSLAIEHTIIEPFVSDKEDFAFFKDVFLPIELDATLRVPGYWIEVLMPVGTLHGKRRATVRRALAEAVHSWLRLNRLALSEGLSKHQVDIGVAQGGRLEIYTRVTAGIVKGALNVRRQQLEDNLGEVVTQALTRKVPKLTMTVADRRVLILERQHMNLYPSRILAEIDKQRAAFPDLRLVDEIWVLETMFYEREGYLRFELYRDGVEISSMDFEGDKLVCRVANGVLSSDS